MENETRSFPWRSPPADSAARPKLWFGLSGRPFPLPEGEPILGLPADTEFFAEGINKVVEELADGLAQFRRSVGATG